MLTMHREFQLFLLGYIIVEICEIFTVGGFPLEPKVRLVRLRLQLCAPTMLILVGFHCCSPRFNSCNLLGSALERCRRFPNTG